MKRGNILRGLGAVLLLGLLTSCGSTGSNGNVTSGPLGLKPLMTATVQTATRQGVNACIDALRFQTSLSALQPQGFVPWRGGHRLKIDNPLILAGGSSVSAKMERDACVVSVGPVYPLELNTIMSITKGVLSGRPHEATARFRRSNDNTDIILR